MFYHGYDGADCQIGVATGTDLTNLTRYSGNPIIPISSSGWDSGTAGYRDIYKEGSYYYMVYEGSTDPNPTYFDAKWSSGVARSADLLSWTKSSYNPILPQTTSNLGYDGPSWLYYGGEFHVRYNGGDSWRRATLKSY